MSIEKKSAHRHMNQEESLQLVIFRNAGKLAWKEADRQDGSNLHREKRVPLPEGREKHISQLGFGELF